MAKMKKLAVKRAEPKKAESRKPQIVETEGHEEIKRLNRVSGQIEGIKKMLEDGRAIEDILNQCKAVHSALKSIEIRLLEIHLEEALEEVAFMDKRRNREQRIAELVELYKPV